MMVLLPFKDMEKSASCFSNSDLFDQLTAVKNVHDILKTMNNRDNLFTGTIAGSNHPQIRLWASYPNHLKIYWSLLHFQCLKRKWASPVGYPPEFEIVIKNPWWFECEQLFESQQAHLLQKNFLHYKQFFPVMAKKNFEVIRLYWPNCAIRV